MSALPQLGGLGPRLHEQREPRPWIGFTMRDVERVKRSQIPTVKASKPYKETPADERLFEQVFGDEFRVAS